MAKKSKKQTRKVSGSGASISPVESGIETNAPVSMTSRATVSDFNPDYSETIKDLKRIGTLAGIFFAILIILSFFLR